MAKKFNPLIKLGFDATLEGCIISPANIYIPTILITSDMEITVVKTEEFNAYDFQDGVITVSQPGYFLFIDNDRIINKVVIDLEETNKLSLVQLLADDTQDYISVFYQTNEYGTGTTGGHNEIYSFIKMQTEDGFLTYIPFSASGWIPSEILEENQAL